MGSGLSEKFMKWNKTTIQVMKILNLRQTAPNFWDTITKIKYPFKLFKTKIIILYN